MGRHAYLQGGFMPLEDAKISVMTHCFLYGTGVFEGIRAYWVEDEEQLYVFRMEEHFQRLHRSARIMRIRLERSVEELNQITLELLRKNGDREDMYLRPVAYKSSPQVGVKLGGVADDYLIFGVPLGQYLDLSKGLKARVSSWRHVEDNQIPMRAKVNGAYANAALIKTEALDDGYDEAIVLTSDGHVSEGSAENIFLLIDGQLVTPPTTDDILAGITRDTLITLAAEELGVPTIQRRVDRTELYTADEIFFCGTGAQVSPVVEIDHRPVGEGTIGEFSKAIQDLYFRVVRGKVERYRKWVTPVY